MAASSNTVLNSGRKRAAALLLAIVLAGAVLSAPAAARTAAARISDLIITIDSPAETAGKWETAARDIIPFQAGDPFDPEQVAAAISVLTQSGLFSDIRVPDPVSGNQGMVLTFVLTPFQRIEKIKISGAFPIFEQEVRQVMTLAPGGAYTADLLEAQPARIKALFVREGFFEPKVRITVQKGERQGHAQICVDIEKGPYYRIRKVHVEGNVHVSAARLKLRTRIWKASLLPGSAARFSGKDLDGDLKNLTRFYREKGFLDVEVDGTVDKDLTKGMADIRITVAEGPRYRIAFEGNQRFWDRTLKKEVSGLMKRRFNELSLRKTARDIKKKYRENGFPDARVTFRIDSQDNNKTMTFVVEEGPEYRVTEVFIEGNASMGEKQIKEEMLTGDSGKGYSARILEDDVSAVRALYLREGFTRARVDTEIRTGPAEDGSVRVAVTLTIDEGVRTRVGSVVFQGLSVISQEDAGRMITLKPGEIFRNYMIASDENLLEKEISERGHPHVRVKGTATLSPGNLRADLVYEVSEGPLVSLGQVVFTGNLRTGESTLEKEMALVPGDPFSLTRLLESQRNLTSMNAMESVRILPLGLREQAPEVDLVVETHERTPYFIEAGMGYDTERHLYLNLEAGDHNFLGRNLDLGAGTEISQIGYQASLFLTEPRFLSTRIASTTKITAEEREEFNKAFGTRSLGLSQSFSRSLLDGKLTAGLDFLYEFREQYPTGNGDPDPAADEIFNPRHIFVTGPSLIYRATDSYVRPTKGIFSALYLDISKGVDDDFDDYVKFRFDTRFYVTPVQRLTLALRGRYRLLEPYGTNDRIPEDQLFFLGGTTSVRGFEENLLQYDVDGKAVGGREAMLASLEARYDLGMNLEFTAFIDTGRLRRTEAGTAPGGFRSAAGIGLRYMTPIGPMGLLYGWKLDPQPGENGGALHFSIGYTF